MNRNTRKKPKGLNVNQAKSVKKSISIWRHSFKRIFLSLSILAVMYIYHIFVKLSQNDTTVMASYSDDIVGSPVGHMLTCSQDYNEDIVKFPKCSPSKCGRFVSDSIITSREALEMRLMAETIFSVSKPSGGVAIFDINSGALSNGTKFINLYQWMKSTQNTIIKKESLKVFRNIVNKLVASISFQFGVTANELQLTSPTFFSRITNLEAKSLNDQYWHRHVDKTTYGSFMYTSLLYLSTYKEDFVGGRFLFLDSKQNITIEPKFGRVSMFTSGSENPHKVEKVTDGIRLALTIAFTCDPTKKAQDVSL